LENIIITGTGVIAGAVARALVPAGYEVKTIGQDSHPIILYNSLNESCIRNPNVVLDILKGEKKVDPFLNLENQVRILPHQIIDLSDKNKLNSKLFEDIQVVVMTASNPNSKQDNYSAELNHQIDKNTIQLALESGVKGIIFTSSTWRTMDSVYSRKRGDPLIDPSLIGTPPAFSHYGIAKSKSVEFIREFSKTHPKVLFAYIDMGWQPRETMGSPISNVEDIHLQWWIAELEVQQHYLLLTQRALSHQEGKENFLAFNGYSRNIPLIPNHSEFPYDLTSSANIGINHRFNVYQVLKEQTSSWRAIPIPSS